MKRPGENLLLQLLAVIPSSVLSFLISHSPFQELSFNSLLITASLPKAVSVLPFLHSQKNVTLSL